MYFALTGCFLPLPAGAEAKSANKKAETDPSSVSASPLWG